jgi:hypothetical protein
MYRQRASNLIAHSTKATTLQADGYLDKLQIEIQSLALVQSLALDLLVGKVDDLYKLAIVQHYNLFH